MSAHDRAAGLDHTGFLGLAGRWEYFSYKILDDLARGGTHRSCLQIRHPTDALTDRLVESYLPELGRPGQLGGVGAFMTATVHSGPGDVNEN